MVEEVVADLGGLHIAVNNAGVNRNHAAEECSEDDWDTTFGLNTKATFLCCQAEGRHMLAQGAAFTSCSRMSVFICLPVQLHTIVNRSLLT